MSYFLRGNGLRDHFAAKFPRMGALTIVAIDLSTRRYPAKGVAEQQKQRRPVSPRCCLPNIIVITLFFCTGFAIPAAVAQQSGMLEVSVASGEIKRTEDGVSTVIATVERGTRLWALRVNGDFARVLAPGTQEEGWIWDRHVRVVQWTVAQDSQLEDAIRRYDQSIDDGNRGNYDVANSKLQEALKLATKARGDDHPAVAQILAGLQICAFKDGRYSDSVLYGLSASTICNRWMGRQSEAVKEIEAFIQKAQQGQADELARQRRTMPVAREAQQPTGLGAAQGTSVRLLVTNSHAKNRVRFSIGPADSQDFHLRHLEPQASAALRMPPGEYRLNFGVRQKWIAVPLFSDQTVSIDGGSLRWAATSALMTGAEQQEWTGLTATEISPLAMTAEERQEAAKRIVAQKSKSSNDGDSASAKPLTASPWLRPTAPRTDTGSDESQVPQDTVMVLLANTDRDHGLWLRIPDQRESVWRYIAPQSQVPTLMPVGRMTLRTRHQGAETQHQIRIASDAKLAFTIPTQRTALSTLAMSLSDRTTWDQLTDSASPESSGQRPSVIAESAVRRDTADRPGSLLSSKNVMNDVPSRLRVKEPAQGLLDLFSSNNVLSESNGKADSNSMPLSAKQRNRTADGATSRPAPLKMGDGDELQRATRLHEESGKLFDEGQIETALKLATESLELRERLLGDSHPDTAEVLDTVAELEIEMGNFSKAETMLRRCLKICLKEFGQKHAYTAITTSHLATALTGQAKYGEARTHYQTVIEYYEDSLGPNDQSRLAALAALAQVEFKEGQLEAAESLLRRVLKALREDSQSSPYDEAIALQSLGVVLMNQAEYAESKGLLDKALQIFEAEFGFEAVQTSDALGALSNLEAARGNLTEATKLCERVVAIETKHRGEDHPNTLTAQHNLANVYRVLGRSDKALEIQRRVLEITEQALGPNHPDTASSLNNLAEHLAERAEFVAAEPLFVRALEIYKNAFGAEHPQTLTSSEALAAFYATMGNYPAAESMYERVVPSYRKVYGSDHPDMAPTLNNFAMLKSRLGDIEAAISLTAEAIRINEAAFGKNYVGLGSSLTNLAGYYRDQMEVEKALPLLLRALELCRSQLGDAHTHTASVQRELANTHFLMKDYRAAEPLYRNAIETLQHARGPAHPGTTGALAELAANLMMQGQLSEAFKIADQSRRGIRSHVTRMLPALSAAEQAMYLSDTYDPALHVHLNMSLNTQQAEFAGFGAAWLANGKAIAQESLAKQNLLMRDRNDPDVAKSIDDLLAVRSKLAALTLAAASSVDDHRLEELTQREQTLVKLLANRDTAVAADWITLDAISEALDADTAFVDISNIFFHNVENENPQLIWGAPRYVAWITVQQSGQPHTTVVDLGDAGEIDALVMEARRKLESAGGPDGEVASRGEEAALNLLRPHLAALADRIWQPIEPEIGMRKNLVISPDATLWLAPWNALPVDKQGDKFLIEDYTVRQVVSARELVHERSVRKGSQPVIFANPNFDLPRSAKQQALREILDVVIDDEEFSTRALSELSGLPKVEPLPNTAFEAAAITPHIKQYAQQSPQLYTEHRALESVVKQLRGPRVATFATHGYFVPSLARDGDFDPDAQSTAPHTNADAGLNPLLRCGLLFAGCNDDSAATAEDDGVLTGMEVVGIDFRGTELVVLSACETALGDATVGEGVAGLRQAFRLAGAESIVATLWQVPDRDSALLMDAFFGNLTETQSRSLALQQAQKKQIERRRTRFGAAHPFFWSAYTLTGANTGTTFTP